MKYILFLFILIGCSENNHTYFPLGKIKSWSYKIEIEPEVDKKTVYKKTNLSLGKKKLELEGKRNHSIHFFVRMVPYFFISLRKMVSSEVVLLLQKIKILIKRSKKEWYFHPQLKLEKNGQ